MGNGEWVEMELETGGTEKVWIPANKNPTTLAEVEFDNTRKKISLHAAGLNSGHYEMLFGLTVAGYFVFTLYDWRSEAKHAESPCRPSRRPSRSSYHRPTTRSRASLGPASAPPCPTRRFRPRRRTRTASGASPM